MSSLHWGTNHSSRDWARLAILVAGMGVILIYAFFAGGYFIMSRGFGELVIFWLITVGLILELTAPGRMSSLGRIELGLFAGYTLWILLSVMWSVVPARSFDEFVRALLYLGGFGLFYLFMSRKEWLGWLGHLFIVIVAIVAIDALLGKTFPDLINHPDPFNSNRLNYPFTYWNTMALFMIMGFIIGLRVLTDRAINVILRSVYAPAMFLFLVVLWFTFSRAGLVLLAASVCLYLYLTSTRLRAIMQAGLLLLWMAVVIAVSYAFLPNMVASVPAEDLNATEGHRLAIMLALFMAIAAGSQFMIRKLEDRISVSPRLARKIGYAIAAGVAIFIASGALGLTFTGGRGGPVAFVGNEFSKILATTRPETPSERLFSIRSERYLEYGASLQRFAEHPLQGAGAGTWSVAWLKYRIWEFQSKEGHSWFFETVAELGLVGTLLLTGFVAFFFVNSVKDLRFLGCGRDRELYAAFFVASTAFLVHAMIDWDWEMPVVTLLFFMFAGGLVRYGQLARARADRTGAGDREADSGATVGRGSRVFPWLLGSACLVALIATSLSMIAEAKLKTAQNLSVDHGQNQVALEGAARMARVWGPLNAEPVILLSQAKQEQGQVEEAERLLFEAREKEPENDRIYRALTYLYMQEYESAVQQGDAAAQKEMAGKAAESFMRTYEVNSKESKENIPIYDRLKGMGVDLPFERPIAKLKR